MKAQYLQFASDGIWETALRLDILADKSTLSDWLATASEDVALEIFFGEAAFIGLRLIPFQHQSEIMQLCDNPSLEALREIFDPELFRRKPDFAELGVVNAWQSVGAKIVWRQGEPIPTLENLKQLLSDSPLLEQLKPLALEFAYTKPLPHWRAMPVSEQSENGYLLDLAQLHQALSHLNDAE